MKKFILFIIILLLIPACKNNDTLNSASGEKKPVHNESANESETNDSAKPEEKEPEVAPTGMIKNIDGDASDLPGNPETNAEYTEDNEDIYRTGKYTGPLVRGVTPDMLKPSFWIKLYSGSDSVIMTHEEIDKYNEENFKSLPYLNDFKTLPEKVKSGEVLGWINKLSTIPKSVRYDEKGKEYQQKEYEQLESNLNTGEIREVVDVKYGLTVMRTEMRTWPSVKGSFSSPSNRQIDYFTETAVYAAEPVLIYHTSADGQWYFAEIYNYKGWIPVKDVALCSGRDLVNYRASRDLLVVKSPVMFTPESCDERVSRLQLDMGVTLPVVSESNSGYIVNYPVGNGNGLELVQMNIPFSEDVSAGFTDYSVKNVLIQAFKFLGEPYGWGGMNNARDCSAFVADVYRSFGIIFPRNSDQQEKMKGYISFNGKSREERIKILDSLKPGTPLYMPGHAMIYLGRWQDRHYIIHDVPTVYRKESDGRLTAVRLDQVSVTPLDVLNSKGHEYIMLLTTAVVLD